MQDPQNETYITDHNSRLNDIDGHVMSPPKIAIIGCGDVGNDIVSTIHRSGTGDAETISVNTDIRHLKISLADKRITIGKAIKGGVGAGGCPVMGTRAAEYGIPTIMSVIDTADLILMTAALGGGTGTAALPLIAERARENGTLVICFVTLPPGTERYQRIIAMRGLDEIRRKADSVIVLDYQKTSGLFPHFSPAQVFRKMDESVAETIREIAELILVNSLINIDFEDLRAVFSHKGIAVLLSGESEEGIPNLNESVTRSTLAHPTAGIEIAGAPGCLICITGGSGINRFDAEDIATTVSSTLDVHADVVWGLNVKREMEGKVRVLAIVTGIKALQDR
jgi:cell division protein FtsZ